MGGHIRVGLGDNLWSDDERTDIATNPRLIDHLVRVARDMGREPATAGQVRELLQVSTSIGRLLVVGRSRS
jgi:uncharacterized protein (DUF849 family)